jgi:hypothetical protein
MKSRILVNTFGVGTLALLFGTTSPWAAQDAAPAHPQLEERRNPVQGVIDVLNLFPQVGVLLVVGTPNDVGFPVGIVAFCSGTLIHERAFLMAGHCTGPASFAPLPPFIQAFVSLSRTRSTPRPGVRLSNRSPTPRSRPVRRPWDVIRRLKTSSTHSILESRISAWHFSHSPYAASVRPGLRKLTRSSRVPRADCP